MEAGDKTSALPVDGGHKEPSLTSCCAYEPNLWLNPERTTESGSFCLARFEHSKRDLRGSGSRRPESTLRPSHDFSQRLEKRKEKKNSFETFADLARKDNGPAIAAAQAPRHRAVLQLNVSVFSPRSGCGQLSAVEQRQPRRWLSQFVFKAAELVFSISTRKLII